MFYIFLYVLDVFNFYLNVVNLCLCSLSARFFIINNTVTKDPTSNHILSVDTQSDNWKQDNFCNITF